MTLFLCFVAPWIFGLPRRKFWSVFSLAAVWWSMQKHPTLKWLVNSLIGVTAHYFSLWSFYWVQCLHFPPMHSSFRLSRTSFKSIIWKLRFVFSVYQFVDIPCRKWVTFWAWFDFSWLSVQVAFHIYRPIMRLFKAHRSSSSGWPADVNKEKDDATPLSNELTLDLGSSQKSVK